MPCNLDIFANDPEGTQNLTPWQWELFTKAHDHITGVVETLYKAHRELRFGKARENGGAGGR